VPTPAASRCARTLRWCLAAEPMACISTAFDPRIVRSVLLRRRRTRRWQWLAGARRRDRAYSSVSSVDMDMLNADIAMPTQCAGVRAFWLRSCCVNLAGTSLVSILQ
jgi:hypothetical protein